MDRLADISLFESLGSSVSVSCFNVVKGRMRLPKTDFSGASVVKEKLLPVMDSLCDFFINDSTPKIQEAYGSFMRFLDAWEEAIDSLREYGNGRSALNRYSRKLFGDESLPRPLLNKLNRLGAKRTNYFQTLGLLRKICADSQAVVDEFSEMMPQSGLARLKVGEHNGKVG